LMKRESELSDSNSALFASLVFLLIRLRSGLLGQSTSSPVA
jgi:hypothetical protein